MARKQGKQLPVRKGPAVRATRSRGTAPATQATLDQALLVEQGEAIAALTQRLGTLEERFNRLHGPTAGTDALQP